jgi:hypothetical protein
MRFYRFDLFERLSDETPTRSVRIFARSIDDAMCEAAAMMAADETALRPSVVQQLPLFFRPRAVKA